MGPLISGKSRLVKYYIRSWFFVREKLKLDGMPPVWSRLSLQTDGPLRSVTKSPIMIHDYIKRMFAHSDTTPAGDPRYAVSFDRKVVTHVQKAAVTTNQALSVGFTLAHLNRGIKELAAMPFSALIEVGLAAFLGLCSGAWLPEMFAEVPAGTTISGVTGSLDDDGQSNAAYKAFTAALLAYDFKLTLAQSDVLYDILVSDDLPNQKHDGTALNEAERATVLLVDLVPPAGGEAPLEGRSKSLKLGDASSTTISQLKDAWVEFMKKVSAKATEVGHFCIIAASCLSGARLGNVWGIEDQQTAARGVRLWDDDFWFSLQTVN